MTITTIIQQMERKYLQTRMDGLDRISNNLFWNQLYL